MRMRASVRLCVCVRGFVYVSVCENALACAFVCVRACMRMCRVCVCVCVCERACVCVRTHVCVHARVRARVRVYVRASLCLCVGVPVQSTFNRWCLPSGSRGNSFFGGGGRRVRNEGG